MAVGRYGLRGSNSGGEKFFVPIQPGSGTHPASFIVGTGSLFQVVKTLGRGADHPPPPSYISASALCLLGM